jgi:hypothetical protein
MNSAPLTKYIVKDQLQQSGVSNVLIGDITLDVFSGNFSIENVSVGSDPQRKIVFKKLAVKLSMLKLLENTLAIELVDVDGLQLHVYKEMSGKFDIGFPQLTTNKSSPATTGDEWLVALQQAVFSTAELFIYSDTLKQPIALSIDLDVNAVVASSLGSVSVASINIDNVSLKNASDELFTFSRLELKELQYAEEMLALKYLALHDLFIDIYRSQDQSIKLLSSLQQIAGSQEKQADAVATENNIHWLLASANILGDSKFRFQDESVTPSVNSVVIINNFSLGQLNSQQPNEKTNMLFKASTDKYDSVQLKGWVSPLADEFAMDLELKAAELNMATLSPYVVDAIGYKMNTGKLSLDSQLKIKEKQLSGEHNIRLDKLTVLSVDTPDAIKKAQAFAADIKLPLNTALNLVRDKKDNINLKIPVEGALSDPQFKLSSVISKAVGKGLGGATMTYLKLAIQPWGALYMLGEKISKSSAHITFDSIEFTPATADLNNKSKQYLEKLAKLLQKKSALRLNLCAVSTGQDSKLVAIEKVALLSKQRNDAIKRYMIEGFSIKSSRLFDCAEEHNPALDVAPYVAISM